MAITKVECDRCKEVFVVEENIVRLSGDVTSPDFSDHLFKDGPDIEEVGFKCPKCGDVTIAYRVDAEIKILQAKVRRERKRADKRIRAGVPLNKAERHLRKAQSSLQRSLDRLNGRDNEPA